ncbi:uncharacterized protein AFUA_3G06255 [Aspergillus fumigatus Af293]|uniref:Uncharacterized protein n=2 Tax=Aspergillus fumigatus TaxID=746128 RepID=A4D9G4_ASPFU|nr:conserved hypothetical protein [Aspergillus fumigatus Af293]EBA27483.1 conserved hypothetical protein [Aspergillus fumigatus Af293]EDP53111.1 conserved hypothetical protein [Aspergillus fumigatus A1163]
MASKKDMRRLDLAIPYIEPPKDKNEADMSGAMSSTMPMAADDWMGLFRLLSPVVARRNTRAKEVGSYACIHVRPDVLFVSPSFPRK